MRFLTDPATVTMGVVSWYTLGFLALVGPLVGLRAHRRLARGGGEAPLMERRRAYVGALLWLWVLLVLSWAAARESGMHLFPAWTPGLVDVAVGLGSLALGLLTLIPRLTPRTGRERVRRIAPRTRGEHAFFYLLCLGAGFGEEVVYRGVLFTLLAALTGSWWAAALLAASIFGAVHLYQGPRSALVAGLYGLRDHLVVGITGTLWVAIAVHVVHDALVGTVVGRRARREEGTPPELPGQLDALGQKMAARGVNIDPDLLNEARKHLPEQPRR
jgi:membrane protease YdiL (CAAX protease family)